jgi:16S rRNA (guanine527-N7)-methyltransferase
MTPESIAGMLQPYVADAPSGADWPRIHAQLATYLDLILKWNARTNLTAIREPEEIVRRHFGESLFVGAHLGTCTTLLDFGSGAGFPGIPIQLLRPEIAVTLAESQGKKAAFLREAIRTLALPTEVWAARVESMPPARQFDTVVLRAVDDMDAAVAEAAARASRQVLILTTARQPANPALATHFRLVEPIPLPESKEGVLLIAHRL